MVKKGSVEPKRDWHMIEEIKENFLSRKKYRDWLMFTLGLNLTLQITDLLQLKVSDVFDSEIYLKNRIVLRERKTGKENVIHINNGSNDALLEYVKFTRIRYSSEYLSQSRRTYTCKTFYYRETYYIST